MTDVSTRGLDSLRKCWALLTASERRGALGLLIMMLIGMTLEALSAGLAIPAIALLTQPDYLDRFPILRNFVNAYALDQRTLVIGGMLVLVGSYLIKTVFLALLAWQQARFAFDVQANLSERLFTSYLRQSYAFHLQRNSAQLVRNAIGEVQQFTGHAMIPGMQLLTEMLVLIGLCVLLFVVEPVGASFVVAVLAISAWAFHGLTRKAILRWGKGRLHHDGLRYQHVQQGLGGVKDVKLLGREAEFIALYRRHNIASARMGYRQRALQQFPRLWLEFLAVVGLAALVLAMLAQGQSIEAILPTIGVFASAAFRTLPSVNRVISSVQSIRYGLPVVQTLYEELARETPHTSGAGAKLPFRTALELVDVDYAYPGSPLQALKQVSITVHRGESVGIIGTSGAGKSTLVDIALGLLSPDRGVVKVDGVDIRTSLRSWQDQIGYVPQSIFLTDDTLRRNVAFGLPDDEICEEAVLHAVRAAQLDEFVSTLPAGLDTIVGERGVRLSGGQLQRIGIARALYHDPPVLVLDEATSSLDTATEKGIIESVHALHRKKTIIIVAHRLSTVERCDRLYKLERGRVVQEGVPAEVLLGSVGT